MGFNLSGFMIKTPITDKTVFEQHLLLELGNESQIIFEEATYNKFGSDFFDVYTTEKGTIILADTGLYDRAGLDTLSEKADLITFNMSETSMAFFFQQFAAGTLQWEEGIAFEDMTKRLDSGNLVMDEKTDVVFETFVDLSTEYIGINFHKIPLEAPAKRWVARKKQRSASIHHPEDPQTEIFKAYFSFAMQVYSPKAKFMIENTKERQVYSFETYLRQLKLSPDKIQKYCSYVKDNTEAYVKWHEKRISDLNNDPKLKTKSPARTLTTALLFIIIVFSVLYALVGLILKPFSVSIWSWPVYFGCFAAVAVIAILFFFKSLVKGIARSRKKMVLKYFDDEEV